MSWDYVTFRSVTPAQRGEKVFSKNGISCNLQRTPKWMTERGCGYCLQIRSEDLRESINLLRENRISFSKVYRKQDGGIVGEVADDLFR